MSETIILENSGWGTRWKTVLTNTHINFYNKEGWISSRWVLARQTPLEQIEEAYVETAGALAQSSRVKNEER